MACHTKEARQTATEQEALRRNVERGGLTPESSSGIYFLCLRTKILSPATLQNVTRVHRPLKERSCEGQARFCVSPPSAPASC